MSNEIKVPIPSRVYNAATGGHVTGAEDIDFGQKVKHLVKYDHSGNEVSFASQLSAQNTIYVIHDDFTLTENVTVPANCVLEFEGGSISGAYTLTGANTGIKAGLVKIFDTTTTLAGTWNVAEAYPEWFGAVGDGTIDDSSAIQKCISGFHIIRFTKHYIINNTILLSGLDNKTIIGSEDSLIESTDINTIFYALGSNQVTFNGLNFEGNRQSGRTYTWPLEQNAAIIFNSDSNNNVVENCRISNFNYGVCLGTDSCSNNTIRSNIFENNNSDIDTYGTPVIIENNISRGCTGLSIQIECYTLNQDIDDYRDYSTSPISVGSRVVDNTIMDCIGTAITVFPGAYSTIISRNTIINYHSYAINIRESTYGSIVSDNIIKNYAGTEATSADSRPINEESAIIIAGIDCKIENNLIIGAQNGIGSSSETAVFSNNVIVNSLHCGLVPTGGRFISNYIKDAGCSSNGWWGYCGVYVYSSNNNIIFEDLTVVATSKAVKKDNCIIIENSGSTPVIIDNCYFKGNTYAAVSGNAIITNPKRMFGVGTTRPTLTAADEGFAFFDKNNGVKKPIWWNGTAWVDATGTQV